MNTCEQVKRVLTSKGLAAIRHDDGLSAHCDRCEDCKRLLRAWREVPGLLDQLPEYEPDSALLDVILTNAAVSASPSHNAQRRRFLAPSLASAAVLLAAIGVSRELLMRESPTFPQTPVSQAVTSELFGGRAPMAPELMAPTSPAPAGGFKDGHAVQDNRLDANRQALALGDSLNESFEESAGDAGLSAELQAGQEGSEVDRLRFSGSSSNPAKPQPLSTVREDDKSRLNKETVVSSSRISEDEAGRDVIYYNQSEPRTEGEPDEATEWPDAQTKRQSEYRVDSPVLADSVPEEASLEIHRILVQKKTDQFDPDDASNARFSREYEQDERERKAKQRSIEAGKTETVETAIRGQAYGNTGPATDYDADGELKNVGFDFLGHYQKTDNLHFQPATGYWANAYIPGDPEIRLLWARLARWDRSWLENDTQLERDVAPVTQPFDSPADHALALNLMADTAVLSDGPSRMRVQVGIRGIEHRRGQRPAMNVGVVVDLPENAPDDLRIAARALLDATLQSKQSGDRFSLVITGQEGKSRSLVVEPGEFRFGSLELAKQVILGQQTAPEHDSLGLYDAMQRAASMVRQNDDPSRPLGSSSVLLISARDIQNIDKLTALAHEQAKTGITLSVFPLGDQPRNSVVEKLVLAGLGNRRYLETPAEARRLIEEELHASSRAVARAARLSIRLAPGVRLIDVVGSERLDTQRAQRVREIENSMDRRLSANLGIQADRGEDEEGIQIVIPSIYSGDSVTVLLDIVTDRPGAIADVSLRYKDLVFLRNGSLRGHLELPKSDLTGGEPTRGPGELTVLKNLLSHHFVEAVTEAAEALGRQQPGQAIASLRAMSTTIGRARTALPAWANDPDLIRDQQVLERFIAALASPEAGANQSFLTDSLRYAAWAKTHRPLEEWK